jgi:hypothetical protein
VKTRGDSNDQTFQDASSQLNEGLRSCRAVVSGYRTLLSGEGGEEPEQVAFNDAGDVAEEAAA